MNKGWGKELGGVLYYPCEQKRRKFKFKDLYNVVNPIHQKEKA